MNFNVCLYFKGNLPEYNSKKYANEHPSEIPYRETPKQYEEKVQPYKHYFPKYTTKYYTTTTYKPQYIKKEEEPYKPQEDKEENYVTKESLYEKEEKGYYK